MIRSNRCRHVTRAGARLFATLLLSVLGVFSAPVSADAEAEVASKVPGTGVRIVLLPGMVPAPAGNGFIAAESGARLQVTEVTVPYGLMAAEVSAEYLRHSGVELESTEETRISGQPATIVSGHKRVDAGDVETWIAVFGTPRKSATVVIQYPRTRAPLLRERAYKAIKSLTWDPDVGVDVDGASFTLSETRRLRINNRVGDVVTLSTSGGGSLASFDEPLVVVRLITLPALVPLDDLETFSREALVREGLVSQPFNHRVRPLEVGGRRAIEIVVDAQFNESGEDLSVYQLLVVGGARRVLLMQAFMARDGFDGFVEEFRELGESLRIR